MQRVVGGCLGCYSLKCGQCRTFGIRGFASSSCSGGWVTFREVFWTLGKVVESVGAAVFFERPESEEARGYLGSLMRWR
jgi:hypothetical protein